MRVPGFNISLRSWAVNFGIFSTVGLLFGLLQLIFQTVFPVYLVAIILITSYFIHFRFLLKEITSVLWGEITVVVITIIVFILLLGTNHASPDSAAVLSYVTDFNPSIEKFSYFSTIWGSSYYLWAFSYGSKLFVLIWRFVQIYTLIYWAIACLHLAVKETKIGTLFGLALFLMYIFSPMFLRHIFSFQTNIASAQTLMALLVLLNTEKTYFRQNVFVHSILNASLLVVFNFMRIDSLILIMPLLVYAFFVNSRDKNVLIIFSLLAVVITSLFGIGQYNLNGLTHVFNKNIFYILMSIGTIISVVLVIGGNTLYLFFTKNIERLLCLDNRKLYLLLFGCVILVLLSLNIKRFDGLYNFLYNTFSYKSIRRSWGVFYYSIVLGAVLGVLKKRSISIDVLLGLSIFILTLVLAGGRRIGEGDSLNRMMLTVGVAFLFPYLKQNKLC